MFATWIKDIKFCPYCGCANIQKVSKHSDGDGCDHIRFKCDNGHHFIIEK